MTDNSDAIAGGCACGHVRYSLRSMPKVVHCCHCRNCKRQTGAALALNALIEPDRVEVRQGEVDVIRVETPSGNGQTIARCPQCQVAVWSNYYMGGLRERIRFIRAGTLDNPDLMPPDVYTFTATRQPWVRFPEGARTAEVFYD